MICNVMTNFTRKGFIVCITEDVINQGSTDAFIVLSYVGRYVWPKIIRRHLGYKVGASFSA